MSARATDACEWCRSPMEEGTGRGRPRHYCCADCRRATASWLAAVRAIDATLARLPGGDRDRFLFAVRADARTLLDDLTTTRS